MTERIAAQEVASPSEGAEHVEIHEVEAQKLETPALVKILAEGEDMILLEVTMPGSAFSPPHTHPHESVGYVVSGRVRTTIDGVAHDLGPGDGFRHPPHVVHNMAAVGEQAVWLEVKSPPVRTWQS